jgi:AcrR family transcriptional regulator
MPASSPPGRCEKSMAVIKAASEVFLAHGFSAATTDMIQKQARVSKATIYSCFPTKEALFAAVIESECTAMSQAVAAIESAPGELSRTLTDIGLSYLGILLSPPALALIRVIVAEAPRFPELARGFYLAGPKAISRMIASKLEEAASRGEIDVHVIGVEAASNLFLSMLRGEAQLECLTHPHAQPSAEQQDRWVRFAVFTFLGAFVTQGRAKL